jgi:methylase of polypeptide subunit release factors
LENLDELKWVKNVIITANLPYIKNRDFINMDQEVIFFEPSVALYWWEETWFELYEKLTQQLLELKEKLSIEKIVAFYEIWFDQYEVSKEFLEKKGLKFDYFKDFNNIYRTIKVEFI